mmetsp:Transcript_2006/g.5659  ORF Transcript_2006/g.5659 Transcript_2006/m.5659 type:complete len:237 (-) Transcript_2006:622-1332(-)
MLVARCEDLADRRGLHHVHEPEARRAASAALLRVAGLAHRGVGHEHLDHCAVCAEVLLKLAASLEAQLVDAANDEQAIGVLPGQHLQARRQRLALARLPASLSGALLARRWGIGSQRQARSGVVASTLDARLRGRLDMACEVTAFGPPPGQWQADRGRVAARLEPRASGVGHRPGTEGVRPRLGRPCGCAIEATTTGRCPVLRPNARNDVAAARLLLPFNPGRDRGDVPSSACAAG